MAKFATLEEAIIDLYLSVKIRDQEEIKKYSPEMHKKEMEKFKGSNPFTIIEYIRSTIDILLNIRNEDERKSSHIHSTKSLEQSSLDPREYEHMLQATEEEVRNHVRIEQQLKLHIDNIQAQLDDQESLNNSLREANKNLLAQNQELHKKIVELEKNLEEAKKDAVEKESMAKSLLHSLHESDSKFLMLKNGRDKSRSRERISQATSDNFLGILNNNSGGNRDSISEGNSKTHPNRTIASVLECRKKSAKGIYEIYSQCLKHVSSEHGKARYHRIKYYLQRNNKYNSALRKTRGSYESFGSKRSMLHSYKHSFSIQEGGSHKANASMRLENSGKKGLLQFSTQRGLNVNGTFKELECKIKRKKPGYSSNRHSQENDNELKRTKSKGVSTVRLKEMKESDHSYKSIGLNPHCLKMQGKFVNAGPKQNKYGS